MRRLLARELAIGGLCLVFLAACSSSATVTPLATDVSLPTRVPPPGEIRPPAVAGSWYPDDPAELAALIDGLLADVTVLDGAPTALIVPHAGYGFSGAVAAAGFKQLEQGEYQVAVIIASDHQAPLSAPISIWAGGGFQTPLGVVPVNVELAQALVAASDLIADDTLAHADEHPIEIELPFLQRVCPDCSIVPILMGSDEPAVVRALADALVEVLPESGSVVIASSDLSHYPSQRDALWVDGLTLSAIETGDPDEVRDAVADAMAVGVPGLATCACGEGPILVAMQVSSALGVQDTAILRYSNSGSSPQGDSSQVVGYGAVMFWRYEPPQLSAAQRDELLSLARDAISEYLEAGATGDYETDDPDLNRLAGVFVTLRSQGQLRGCIGHTMADLPLYLAVQRMAVVAAVEDPRFPSLTAEELADVTLEISVLSPFHRLTDVEEIEVGTHGLVVAAMGRQGLLLPQVPVEQGWDRTEFLDNLCQKAGITTGCWQEEGVALYSFTALVFGEE